MGVRGTRFVVQISPAADLLISCEEGNVVCVDRQSGTELNARPGEVVEKPLSEVMQSFEVDAAELKSFRENWIAERISAFKADPLRAIRFYALRYNRLYRSFNTAYGALMQETSIIDRWIQEDKAGNLGDTDQRLRDKKIIIGHLIRIRRVLFLFERIHHRLIELYRYYRQGYGTGEIDSGLTVESFFTRFASQRRETSRKIARVRYITKLYSKRNEGSVPISEF
jgi:hypothetical protein